jgi:hypothetical protein
MFSEGCGCHEIGRRCEVEDDYNWALEKGPYVEIDDRRHFLKGREVLLHVGCQPSVKGNEADVGWHCHS